MASHDYDIIVFTETFGKEGIFSNEMFDCRYEVFRRDRDSRTSHKKSGGGVIVAIKKSHNYRATRRRDWENETIEEIWISIKPLKGKSLHINASYIPDYVSDASFKTHISSISERVNALCDDQITLLGDFNASDFCTDQSTSLRSRCLKDLMDFTSCNQINHTRNSKSDNLLDLIFTNFFCRCEVSQEALTKIDEYHPPLVADIKLKIHQTARASFSFRPFHKINYKALNARLAEIDWATELEMHDNVNDAVDKFYTILTSQLDLSCPIISRSQTNEPRWIKRDTLRLKREKRKAHSRWKKYKNSADYDNYHDIRERLDEQIKSDYDEHLREVEKSLQENPKQFWKFVNNRRSNGVGLADYITWEGEVAENKKDVANLFAKRFGMAFSDSDPQQEPDLAPSSSATWYSHHFHLFQIFDKLKTLKINKAAGPDGLPPILFKNCATSLTFPLYLLFNASLSQGVVPSSLKLAHVTPIFKSGSATEAKNYRPVSKLSLIAKVFDSLIADELFTRFSSSISIHQHGFYKKRSTVTNLASYTEFIERVLDKAGQVDTLYTDFSSAFDKVPHKLLIRKLNAHGIGGTMLKWFSSYLTGRRQKIQIGNVLSDEMMVP